MDQYDLWIFNLNIWTCDGVYVIQDLDVDLNVTGRDFDMPLSELEKRILRKNGAKEIRGVMFSEDGKVRFAPKGEYRLGYHTGSSFAKDGFAIASCDLEGAEKLGEVSYNFPDKAYIGGFKVKEHEKPEKYVSSINIKPAGDFCLTLWGNELYAKECIAYGLLV